ncbi:MAG: ATP-binding cassette domain-containing protein [Synergistaceae bacterium]|jgi:energy-coupling factor transport system ATP-binding protein|nr:ATP-binding cassette domain-containing protein [Synergistaceae bacterium]
MNRKPIFSLRGVEYAYPGAPSRALCGLDLEIAEGEWVALVGANGSGKSTLAKICNALLTPTQGDCFVMGRNTRDETCVPDIRRAVSLVFQNPEDQIVASVVEEDVAFGPENLGLPSHEIRVRVDRALEMAGLASCRLKGSFSLSGGQKQRLALAGALAMQPAALILDESTSMLDPEGRQSFLSCLGSLKSAGMTIVQITHRMEEAIQSDRVVVIDSGRSVWDGTPGDFFGGAYVRWNFEEPPDVSLYRELLSRGLLPDGTLPDVGAMLDALCLS